MENNDKVIAELEIELVQILEELGMAPDSHRDFGWLKEVIIMAVRHPLIWEAQWAEYIGKRENITRERVIQILHKAVWNHWNLNSENIIKKHFEAVQVQFEYVKPNHIELIKLIAEGLREKYLALP